MSEETRAASAVRADQPDFIPVKMNSPAAATGVQEHVAAPATSPVAHPMQVAALPEPDYHPVQNDVTPYRSERTPPGSYLIYRVTTVDELRKELATNKLVQDRYARHFGVSPDKLDKFLADNIQLIALKHPLKVDAWYIDRNGKISVKKKLLPAGTMVFATKSGEPVLTWSCGNPLRPDLPETKVKAESEKTPLVKVEAAPVEVISTAVVTAPPTPAVVSMLPVESAPPLAFAAAPAVSMPPLLGSVSNLSGWLGALGGVVLLKKSPTFNKVPEPSSLLAMVSLLGMMPAIYRARRRR